MTRMFWLFALSAKISFLADRLTKAWAENNIPPGTRRESHCGRFVLTNVQNRGAFNHLLEKRPVLLKILSLLALVNCALLILGVFKNVDFNHSKSVRIFCGMLFGAGLSSVWDRFTKGYAIDFVQIACKNKPSPVFNLADVFIVTGGLGLLIVHKLGLIIKK